MGRGRVVPSFGRNAAVSLLFTVLGGPALVLVLLPWTLTHFRIAAGEPMIRIVAAAGTGRPLKRSPLPLKGAKACQQRIIPDIDGEHPDA